jgi:hypothetical protein
MNLSASQMAAKYIDGRKGAYLREQIAPNGGRIGRSPKPGNMHFITFGF